jgi:branched-chain amino acid transport system substrate-binding protein
VVSPSNSLPSLTDSASREAGYFRTSYTEREQGERMAQYALDELGAVTAAVIARHIAPEAGIDRAVAEAFADVFEAGGGTMTTAVFYDPADPEPAAAVAAVVAAGVPDVLVVVGMEQSADLVIEVRSQPALDSTAIMSSRDYLGFDFLALAGQDAEGLYATGATPPEGAAYDAFAAAREARFGTMPQAFDAYAYDAATVLLNAIGRTGVIDGPVVRVGLQGGRDQMAATAGIHGASGTITCDPFGDCAVDPSFDVFQVQGGAFVIVG